VPESYLAPYGHLKGNRKTYAGMLAAMDEAIGQVVAALEEKKMLGNTLIIFSSDNGGPSPGTVTDNGSLREGKGTIYEGGVRVCAFASWPGHIPAGKVVNEPIHIIDWYPTLVTLAGGSLKQPLPLDGKDLWPVLTQGAKSPHEALLLHSTSFGKAAVRVGDWKLLQGQEGGKGGKKKAAGKSNIEYQLYNLANDIGETKNLATSNPEKLAEMKDVLERLVKDAVPSGEKGQAGSGKEE
jgi:arylsulfatase A-like enzyme